MPVTSATLLEIAQQAQDAQTGLTRVIVTDTAGTNETTVKAASTAAVATDTAMVVAVSPNNTVAVTTTELGLAQGSTTSGQKGPLVQGAVTTAAPTYTTAQTDPLSLTTSGALRVDIGATSANATAVKVDGSAVTQPISSANLDLAQASTTSGQKGPLIQAAVTTAAPTYTTAQTDPLSLTTSGALRVDIGATSANATAVKVDGSAVTQPISSANLDLSQASTTSGQKGPLIQGAVTTAAPTYTTAQTDPLSLTTSGALRVDLGATSANATAVKVDNSAVTQPENLTQIGGNAVLAGNGVTGTGSLRVTIASDNTAFTVNAAQSGTWTVQPGNTANTTAWLVKEQKSATATVTSVASSATSVSLLASTAGRLGATFFNDSTAILYLKLGTTASTSSYTVQIASNGYYELPPAATYTGAIDGIWASANGNVRITELT